LMFRFYCGSPAPRALAPLAGQALLRAKGGGAKRMGRISPPLFARRRACPASGASALGAGLLHKSDLAKIKLKQLVEFKRLQDCFPPRWARGFGKSLSRPREALRLRRLLLVGSQ